MGLPAPDDVDPPLPVQEAPRGAHLCAFTTSADERRELTAAFVLAGLAAGDRVVQVVAGRPVARAAAELDEAGIGIDELRDHGQLVLLDARTAYGTDRALRPEEGVGALRAVMEGAAGDGYPGVHVAADSGWFLAAGGGIEDLVAWEDMLSDVLEDAGAVGLCRYDSDAGGHAARIAGHHDALAVDGGLPPMATFRTGDSPSVVRVAGEVDVSNAATLRRVVRARLDAGMTVRIDLSGLAFADLSGLRALVGLLEEVPAGRLIVGPVPSAVRRLAELAGLDAPGLGGVEP